MNNLQKRWGKASNDLNLKVIYNFCLVLESGYKINSELLLLGFGGEKGMLILSEFDKELFQYGKELISKGYGYSVLSNYSDVYDRNSIIGLLSDWGWSGPKEEEPDWILPVDEGGNVIKQ